MQNIMAKEDSFQVPWRAIGLFEWVAMIFGVKNTGATYQKAINGKYLKKYYPSVCINT